MLIRSKLCSLLRRVDRVSILRAHERSSLWRARGMMPPIPRSLEERQDINLILTFQRLNKKWTPSILSLRSRLRVKEDEMLWMIANRQIPSSKERRRKRDVASNRFSKDYTPCQSNRQNVKFGS